MTKSLTPARGKAIPPGVPRYDGGMAITITIVRAVGPNEAYTDETTNRCSGARITTTRGGTTLVISPDGRRRWYLLPGQAVYVAVEGTKKEP